MGPNQVFWLMEYDKEPPKPCAPGFIATGNTLGKDYLSSSQPIASGFGSILKKMSPF